MKAPDGLVMGMFAGSCALTAGAVVAVIPALGVAAASPFLFGASLVTMFFIPQASKAVEARRSAETVAGYRGSATPRPACTPGLEWMQTAPASVHAARRAGSRPVPAQHKADLDDAHGFSIQRADGQ